MIGELHVGDDLRLEQADRVAGDRIAEAGMKLLGHRSAADDVARLDDPYLQTRFREIEGADEAVVAGTDDERSEEHTSELQSLMRISYAVFCLKKKKNTHT